MPGNFIDACVDLADLYQRRFVDTTVEACPDFEEDPWDSLRFFVLGYAFEHKVRSPDCARAAIDAIEEAKDRPFTRGLALRVWETFSEKMKGRGLIHPNNPLCPQGTSYQRKYKGTVTKKRVRGISALEFAGEELEGKPVVTWARDSIRSRRLAKAHRLLTIINGVSETTASRFLRDVATMYGIRPPGDRRLLQPVDSWITLVARASAGDPKLSADACASLVLKSTSEPEKASQGVWYYCTQIAGAARRQVSLSLADPGHMSFLLDDHLRGLVVGGEAAIAFVSRRQPGLLKSALARARKTKRVPAPKKSP